MKGCVGLEEGDDRFIALHELVRDTHQLYDKVNPLFLWADVHEIPFLDRFDSVLLSCIKLSTTDKPRTSICPPFYS
jgi:hypothetical protein